MRLKTIRSGYGTPSRFGDADLAAGRVGAALTLRTTKTRSWKSHAARRLLERDDVGVGTTLPSLFFSGYARTWCGNAPPNVFWASSREDLAVGEERPDRRHPERLVPGSKLKLPVTVGSRDW